MHSKMFKRVLAGILVFTLTFANPALVTKSFATSIFDMVNNQSGTGNKNIEFNAGFDAENAESFSAISDVNNEDLAINLRLNVKDKGYLKNGKVQILEGTEGAGLNFELRKEDSKSESSSNENTDIANSNIENSNTENAIIEESNNQNTVSEPVENSFETVNTQTEEMLTENMGKFQNLDTNTSEEAEAKNEQNSSNNNVSNENVTENTTVSNETTSTKNENTEKNEKVEVKSEMVESIEDNIISLKQINAGSDVLISVPIEYKNEEYVNLKKLSDTSKIIFTGIYVDGKGNENEVSKEVDLTLSWKDERNVKITTDVTKYIPYKTSNGNGIILQTLVTLDNTTSRKSLPVKKTELSVSVPTINDVKPNNVTITANSTAGTNGKSNENVVFTSDNWAYNQEDNTLNIHIQNGSQVVKIDNTANDVLKDAEKVVKEEERYYSVSGKDEYTITYSFENIEAIENLKLNSNVSGKMETFTGDSSNAQITEAQENYEFNLDGQKGEIVSLETNNETKNVSKAYTYLNYNNKENYEIKFNSKNIVNISYKDIVESIKLEDKDIYYVAKDGNKYSTTDVKYKTISFQKENINNILGEEGIIRITDASGNEISTINKETATDENGNIVIDLTDKNLSKLSIQTSKPITDGNLIINVERAMKKSEFSKEQYKNFSTLIFENVIKAKYSYVEAETEIATNTIQTNLRDTITKANLVIDRDSLSTIAMNNDVEMRVELNNNLEESDVYGNSIFEIEMPAYIQRMDITNTNIVYGEGLEIQNVELFERDGRVYIRITLNGQQEYLNSGVLTNGCNIVINANIQVNLFTPAMEQQINLTYTNSEATNYENNQEYGSTAKAISYSAPTGLLTVNTTSNYDEVGSMITSVRQGKKEDTIEIYAPAKTAKMEVIVMNNNKNTISDLTILGRIPFKGVKDIETGEDLGTTLDTKMVSKMVADSNNRGNFKIYYSENPEATKDLENTENAWKQDVADLSNIKSYLIVPETTDYIMNEAETLRFTYEYEIPGNLEHNTDIYGTFLAYYTNNTEIATVKETSTADKVGLTTGEGPQVDISLKSDIEKIKEFEELKLTTSVTNTGKSAAKDIVVKLPIPNYTEYVSALANKENVTTSLEDNMSVFKIDSLAVNETVNLENTIKVQDAPEEQKNIEAVATITAKDLQKELSTNTVSVELKQAEMAIEVMTEEDNTDGGKVIYKEGEEYFFNAYVDNLKSEELTNAIVKLKLPEEFSFVEAYMLGYEEDGLTSKKIENATYNESTREVIWKTDSIRADGGEQFNLTIKVNDLPSGTIQKDVTMKFETSADNTETYTSNEVLSTIAKPSLTVSQKTLTTNTYVKEGETIEYVFEVKNEGIVAAEKLTLNDKIPDGLIVKKIDYIANGVESSKTVSEKDSVEINTVIMPGEELIVNVKALAVSLNGMQEKTVTNAATVSAKNVETVKTNTITHIVEATDKSELYDTAGETTNTATSQIHSSNSNLVKTYKITGIAWLDENGNGKRDDEEQKMSGITARLVNSDTGTITKTTVTDSRGEYTFSGIENGNYLVLFDYDTVKYTVTTYRQAGVEANVNSDAITTKIEQDGKQRNGAVTDVITIQDLSVSNIDIGFVLADTFDLKLDKSVTKITAQNKVGTNKAEFNNSKLAKMDVAGKYISSTVIYVEYNISVSNTGDVAGYAKKIVDYIPEGMTFNSNLNSDWYTGTDGNLYTSSLAEVELKPGETRNLKLVLTKQMTEENTGIVNNNAEIYEDFNIYGISDKNSTPGNKVQNENDMSSADAMLTIKTGESLIYVSVIITSAILGAIVIFITYNKIVISKRKRGGV